MKVTKLNPDRVLQEPTRDTPIRWEGDVVVLGGGCAGVCAAVAAARSGASVLLLERHGFLGGIMTAVSLGTICGLFGIDAKDKPYALVSGLAEEIVTRLRKHGGAAPLKRWIGAVTIPYDMFAMKMVFDEMTVEAGVRIAFHALAVDVIAKDGHVDALVIQDKSGRWAARAKCFVDASGDADLIALATGEFEFDIDSIQLPTTTFRMACVDDAVARAVTREDLRERLESANSQGAGLPRTCGGVYFEKPGTPHLNLTRVSINGRSPNPFDTFELTDAELEGRRQVLAYGQAFREHVPGYADSFVLDSGAHIGIRESRRMVGDYRLDIDEVYAGARFEDGIASCAWPVEVHERGTTSTRWDWLPPGQHYQIPFRSLLPRKLSNVVVAGRCISSSHEAHGSLRVTATCMAMGQAAGVATALAALSSADVRDIPFSKVKSALLGQGALLDASEPLAESTLLTAVPA